jgi:aminoglycoside 2'-N-acetyltransferase I
LNRAAARAMLRTMEIRAWPWEVAPEHIKAQVLALQDAAWPETAPTAGESPSGDGRAGDGRPSAALAAGHDPALRPVTLVLLAGDIVVATLDVLSKQIEHDGEDWAASGLSAVVTDPAKRGRGHGTQLVAATRAAMRARGADLGIFSCDAGLVPFYVGAGWHELPGAVLVGGTPEDPLATDALGKVVLAEFFSSRARSREASFRDSHIALFPGKIDKLW